MSVVRRALVAVAVAVAATVVVTVPAFAHTGFTPDRAAPGTVVTLELSVQNERSDSGTTQVELVFPEGTLLVVADLPLTEGWTAAVEGGAIGAAATGVTWTRPDGPPGENPLLSVRLGPMPATEQRLQFKVVQTYANGDVDRWIDDWPAGAPEPERPGPVIDLVAGAPGDPAPPTTTDAPDSNASPTTSAVAAPLPGPTVPPVDDSDDGVPIVPVVLVGLVVVLTAAGLVYRARRR